MIEGPRIAFVLAVVLGGLSLLYAALCVVAVVAWRRRRADPAGTELPPVTVLKPLCGLEPDLEENLRSFCHQAYPTVQLLFGARSGDDPALEVARRVAAEFPGREIEVLSGERALGGNRKINTLANLLPSARHDVFVIADSDIRVGPTYLREVVTPLLDPAVGLVTCIYRGAPTGPFWSRFGALAIDEWVFPSVLVSLVLGSTDYCSGATMALRRDTLEAIGGFAALAPWLADDHELGARVWALGLRRVVSRYEVATTVHEPDFRTLFAHELR
ncbi:MAG TPA: bacteriohopanetetrol glucosamine biosynthesis glycosyltransferase HpnI, partial [Gemmatimonadales bacterium]|nr:bacteriohopanetetrol glucosamine biosynthesis glycosyltransferase HpnI [Gemmatimonadales bacterium]